MQPASCAVSWYVIGSSSRYWSAEHASATAKSGPVPTNQGHRSVLIPGPPASVRIRITAYRRRSPVWEGWGRVANAGSMTGVPDRTTRPLGRAGRLAGEGPVEELQPCQPRVDRTGGGGGK